MILDRIPVRYRLSIVHSLCIATLFICIGYGLYKIVEKNLNDSVNAALISSAKSIRDARYTWGLSYQRDSLIEQFFHGPLEIDQLTGARFIKPYARIINVSGESNNQSDHKVRALPVSPKALNRAENGLSTLETFSIKNRAPLRQVTIPVMENDSFTGEIVQVGVFLDHTLETMKSIALVLWIVLPMTLLISILLAYILTVRALKPVKAISQAASKMYIDDLSIRLPLPLAKDEIYDLSCTFNNMFDRLEDAVKRLRRFTGDVSHELRTPLAVLRGEAELCLRKPREENQYRAALNSIVKEAIHMSSIVEDLLLLAKAESKSVAISWSENYMKNFIENLHEKVKPIYKSKKITLNIEVFQIDKFFCSQGYLSLALKNILLNAAKHSAPESEVSFNVRRKKNKILFEIKDRGEGIPKDSIRNVFDPFFRVDTVRNRASGGAGIGLSLALALVKLHEGDIEVNSVFGQGTTFIVKIPFKDKI